MTNFLVFGGVIFWIILAVLSVALLISVNMRKPGWSAVIAAGVLYVIGAATIGIGIPDWSAFEWLLAIAGYFVAGAVYSTAAWFLFVRAIRRFVDNYQSNNLESALAATFPADPRPGNYGTVSLPPIPSEHKTRIQTWIAFWPVHLLAYIVGDRLRFLVVRIYEGLTGIFSKISSSAFKGYSE